MVVVRVALARGYLSQVQLRQALLLREQLRAAGRQAELLPILRARFLDPRVIHELTEIYRQAAGSDSQRLPSARSTSSRRVAVPEQRKTDTAIIDPRELPAPARIADDDFRRSGELLERPLEEDPAAVRDFLRQSTHSENATVIDSRLRKTSSRRIASHPVGWGSNDGDSEFVSPARPTGRAPTSPMDSRGPGPQGSGWGSAAAPAFGASPDPSRHGAASAFGASPVPGSFREAGGSAPPRPPTWKDPPSDGSRPTWGKSDEPNAGGERRAAPPPPPRPLYEYEPPPPPPTGLGTAVAVGAAAFALVLSAGVGTFALSGGIGRDVAEVKPEVTPAVADPPQADPPKADPPKADPPKADPPKVAAPTEPAPPPRVTEPPSRFDPPSASPSSDPPRVTPPPAPSPAPSFVPPAPRPVAPTPPQWDSPPPRRPPPRAQAQPQGLSVSVPIDGGVVVDGLPAEAKAAYERSVALKLQGNLPGMLEALSEAIEAAPKVAGLWVERAAVAFVLRRTEDAERDLGQALVLEPKNGRAFTYRAVARHSRRDVPAALRDAQRGVELGKEFPFAYQMLAMVQYSASDRTAARATLDDGIARCPSAPGLYLVRAQLRGQDGDVLGAEEDCGRVSELSESLRPSALLQRSRLRAARRDMLGSIADLDAILALDLLATRPSLRGWVGSVHLQRGLLTLQAMGQLEASLPHLEKFVELSPPGHPQVPKIRDLVRRIRSGELRLQPPPGSAPPPAPTFGE